MISNNNIEKSRLTIAYIDAVNSTAYYNLSYISELAKHVNIVFYTSRLIYEDVCFPKNASTKFTFFNLSFSLRDILKQIKLRKIVRGIEYPIGIIVLIFDLFRTKPDIIHFNWVLIPQIDYIIIKFLKIIGWPIIYTSHNSELHDSNGKYLKVYKKILNTVDYVICLTEHVKKEITRKYNVNEQKIVVIPHGDFDFIINQLKTNKVFSDNRQNRKSNNFTVTYFGQIRPYKGLSYFIKAIPYVIEKYPECKFLISGKDTEGNKKYYLEMIHEMNLDGNVVCDFRYIPLADLINYLEMTDIVVLPYTAASQSGNIPMLSKMGIPVIATRVGGLPEMIKEGRNGFLVMPKDEKAIAEAICKLISNPSLLAKMRRESVIYAKEAFSWKNIAMRTMGVYEKVAEQKTITSNN